MLNDEYQSMAANRQGASMTNDNTTARQAGLTESGYRCADCKAPLRPGYTCDVCNSDAAEEISEYQKSHHEPSWQVSYKSGYNDGVQDGRRTELAAQSAPARNGEGVALTDGWLQDRGLIYRLTDERHPQNRDEINVTMANGSRKDEDRIARAREVLALLAAPAAPAPWKCGARAHGDLGGHGPMDCNWPECGCDPHVERVIAGLQECGWTIAKDAAALVAQEDSLEAFKTWVTTVWRPDDGAELLKREFPRFAFAAWQAARQQSATPAGPVEYSYGDALEAAKKGVCLEYRRTPHDAWRFCEPLHEMNAHYYYRLATPPAASEADKRDANNG